MVLIAGLLSDTVLRYVCAGLLAEEVDFVLLDVRQYPEPVGLSWHLEPDGQVNGELHCGDRRIDLAGIRSVYARVPDTREFARRCGGNPAEHLQNNADCDVSLSLLLERMPCLVVNRPSAQCSNAAKPFQQQLIQAQGFATPRTLLTSDPAAARAFYQAFSGQVIYKSISCIRSIVQRLSSDQLERLEHLRVAPVQLQEYIAGVDIRVHVVGSELFATQITTDADDYRYASRQGSSRRLETTNLPSETEARCFQLAEALCLPFAGIDLRRTADGEYYCFEVNPAPAFTFYERQTGQPICAALIQLLSRGTLRPSPRPAPLTASRHRPGAANAIAITSRRRGERETPLPLEPFITRKERPKLALDFLSDLPPAPERTPDVLHALLAPLIEEYRVGPVEPVFRRNGPVMAYPRVFSLFPGSLWQDDPVYQQVRARLDDTMPLLMKSAYLKGLKQYAIGQGCFQGSLVVPCVAGDRGGDGNRPPGSLPPVQAFLSHLHATRRLPPADGNTLVLLFPQASGDIDESLTVSLEADACQGALATEEGQLIWSIVWPRDPLLRPIENDFARYFDSLTLALSHALVEAITSPLGANGNIAHRCRRERPGRSGNTAVVPYWLESEGCCRIPTDEKNTPPKKPLPGARCLCESRIERAGLKAGTAAPSFTLPDIHGRPISLADYRGRRVLLLFSDPECRPCNALAPGLVRLHRQQGKHDPALLMVGRGDPDANRRKAMEHGIPFPVALQKKWEISRQYGIFATPVAFLLDEAGVIARDPARGAAQILALAEDVMAATRAARLPCPRLAVNP